MFERKEYKKMALEQLKGRWVNAVVTAGIYILAEALLNYTMNVKFKNSYIADFIFVASIVVNGIITMAVSYYFLKMSRTPEPMSFNDFLTGLSDYFIAGICGMAWFMLWFLLWAFLFIIPGFVKAVSYSQMFFILAENPGMPVSHAMNLSKTMTYGRKGDLFVMFLSFTGWILLSCVTGGIGFFVLCPYMMLSFSNAYTGLKTEALKCGILTPADFAVRR